jgi:AraC-like DNA-binding protein
MIGCGTVTFTDPEDFRSGLRGPVIDLVQTASERFRARLIWLTMRRLSIVQFEESAPRIAFVSLPAGSVSVSFPLAAHPPARWNGVALARGCIVLHGPSSTFHHRTTGPARWGMAWLPRAGLAAHGRALLGTDLALPQATALVEVSSSAVTRFQRLHAQACRLAHAKPDVASHPEVMRALEQDLVHALVGCIAGSRPRDAERGQRHAETMARFEEVLAARSDRPLSMPELSAAVGVPERTLRMVSVDFLGLSPLAYARLRRLNLARRALLRGDAGSASVASIARTYGFSELGRFAAAYRALFAEPPSATLRGAESRRSDVLHADTIR